MARQRWLLGALATCGIALSAAGITGVVSASTADHSQPATNVTVYGGGHGAEVIAVPTTRAPAGP